MFFLRLQRSAKSSTNTNIFNIWHTINRRWNFNLQSFNQIKADTQKYATKNWVIIIITFYSTLREKQVMTNYLFNWPKTKTYVNSYWDYFLNSTHHIFSGLNKEEYDEEYGKNSSDMKPTSLFLKSKATSTFKHKFILSFSFLDWTTS